MQLRKDVCDWIEKHKARYEPFVEDERGIDVHLRLMRQPGMFACLLFSSHFLFALVCALGILRIFCASACLGSCAVHVDGQGGSRVHTMPHARLRRASRALHLSSKTVIILHCRRCRS